MAYHTEFHKWNLLPEELKLECIKHVDLNTRYRLRRTSRTERRLVNSQSFDLCKVAILDGFTLRGHIYVNIYEKSLEELTYFEFTQERIDSIAVPFLIFLLEKANITDFECWPGRDEVREDLRFLAGISQLRVRNFKGLITPDILPVLEKCPANTVEKAKISYTTRRTFPVDDFLKYPMVESVRHWDLAVMRSQDLGQKIGRKWIELDVDVGSEYRIEEAENEDMETFATAFPEFKMIEKSEKVVRIETGNPKKHLLLIISRDEIYNNKWRSKEWTLIMIPNDFPQSKYTNENARFPNLRIDSL